MSTPREAFTNKAGEWNADHFKDSYVGEYANEVEFGVKLFDDLGYLDEIPEHLDEYIDYKKWTDHLFERDFWAIPSEGGIYVFRRWFAPEKAGD